MTIKGSPGGASPLQGRAPPLLRGGTRPTARGDYRTLYPTLFTNRYKVRSTRCPSFTRSKYPNGKIIASFTTSEFCTRLRRPNARLDSTEVPDGRHTRSQIPGHMRVQILTRTRAVDAKFFPNLVYVTWHLISHVVSRPP